MPSRKCSLVVRAVAGLAAPTLLILGGALSAAADPLSTSDGTVSVAAPVSEDATGAAEASTVAPVAVDDVGVTDPGIPVTVHLLANDADADGQIDPAAVRLIGPATGEEVTGPVTVSGQGTWDVDPATGDITFVGAEGFTGGAAISYVVRDDAGNVSNPAEIDMTVVPPMVPLGDGELPAAAGPIDAGAGLIDAGQGTDSGPVWMVAGVGLVAFSALSAAGPLVIARRRHRAR